MSPWHTPSPPSLPGDTSAGGTERYRHSGGPRAEPHKAGHTKAKHRDKGDNTEGQTIPSHPTNATVPQPESWPVPHLLPPPNTHQGHREATPCPLTPRTPGGAEPAPGQRSPGGCCCPRGPRHFWFASASLQQENGGSISCGEPGEPPASGAAAESGRAAQHWTLVPSPSCHPRSTASQEPGPA